MSFPRIVSSGAWTGYFPVAPGTFASVFALGIGAVLLWVSPYLLLAAAILATLGGIWAIGRLDDALHDPGWVVIDEYAGQFIALLGLATLSWTGAALAFVLFRLFDIAKPGPVGWADRMGGAVGVMLDDVIAGVLAGIIVFAARMIFPGYF